MKAVYLILVIISLTGCASVSRYEKNGLVAFGETINESNVIQYYMIRINAENGKTANLPKFLVKLSPDAEPRLWLELTPEYVAGHLPLFNPPEQLPEKVKERMSLYPSYEGNGFNFSFNQGRLSSFTVCSNCGDVKQSPIIGTADGRKFYRLPLSYGQIIDLWGEPDRLYKVREVTY